MQAPNPSPVTVTDGTDEAQSWVDRLVAVAEAGTDGWPHPHLFIPASRITLRQLHFAIEKNYFVDNRRWSVERDGYPPMGASLGPPATVAGFGDDPGSRGSMGHNLLHNLLGNFH